MDDRDISTAVRLLDEDDVPRPDVDDVFRRPRRRTRRSRVSALIGGSLVLVVLIALAMLARHPKGRADHLQKKREGKTKQEAFRFLKRRISGIYSTLRVHRARTP